MRLALRLANAEGLLYEMQQGAASDRRGARVPRVSRVAVGPWDRNEGRSMPCRHCDGSGRVVTCLECACDVAAPEAEEMGHYCARCRADLDRAAE